VTDYQYFYGSFAFGPQAQRQKKRELPVEKKKNPPPATCTVRLTARPVQVAAGITGQYHAFVSLQAAVGPAMDYHAGPATFSLSDPGPLGASKEPHEPGNYEYEAEKSSGHVASDEITVPGDCSKFEEVFLDVQNRTNNAKLPYQFPTPGFTRPINNSNAYAYTLLNALGGDYANKLGKSVIDQIYRAHVYTDPWRGNNWIAGWGYQLPIR
jgi:hypothetical protein